MKNAMDQGDFLGKLGMDLNSSDWFAFTSSAIFAISLSTPLNLFTLLNILHTIVVATTEPCGTPLLTFCHVEKSHSSAF